MAIASLLCLCLGCLVGCSPEPAEYSYHVDFENWCDNVPCGFELVSGAVYPASTWHEHETALGFEGEAELSQLNVCQVETQEAALVLVHSVEADASIVMTLSFYNLEDCGHIADLSPRSLELYQWDQITIQLGGEGVRRRAFRLPAFDWTAGLHLQLQKSGPGQAWIDEIVVRPINGLDITTEDLP